jgi:uncharacterized membrane protein
LKECGLSRVFLGVLLVIMTPGGAKGDFTVIEPPLGHTACDLHGISDDGNWAVGACGFGGLTNPYRWGREVGAETIGSNWFGEAVSNDGTVVVGTGSNGGGAHRWGPGGVVDGHNAIDVSADGEVVVGQLQNFPREAYRWTASTGSVGLGFLPGSADSQAYGVSRDGEFVVGNSGPFAFRWRSTEGMIEIGVGVGRDVSDDGQTVVGGNASGPFRWTHLAGLTSLGLSPGCSQGHAAAVTSDGSTVVGFSQGECGAPYGVQGFIWNEVGGLQPIEEFLQNEWGLVVVGWRLQPTDISGDGRMIGGSGWDPAGVGTAWVATKPVPEPDAALLHSAVALSLAALRAVKRRNL